MGSLRRKVEPGVWEGVGSAPLRHGHVIHAAVMFRRAIGFIRHDIESCGFTNRATETCGTGCEMPA